ncbi:FTR1 family iron permease [Magnetospirillum molischianum]|uniref:High-affinity Fe2+/Pb2+ permease n=1 Tax=Magnetospirillum molischianum DSM 120 TaxID=1150626 RepID=H8FN43_MAGML|nr:FTR1 family protein [Magnetospirillum molischianum]CCG39781.1 High-affinity Fe2+/Pb2+ permease [Magnetospirillum molischianum DSM 120]
MMRRLFLALAVIVTFGLSWSAPSLAAQLDVAAAIAAVQAKGDSLVAEYDPAQKMPTMRGFSSLYFEQFDGDLENTIGAADSALKSQLEAGFAQVIGQIRKGGTSAEVQASWQSLRDGLDKVPERIGGGGALATFIQSFLILVREGFEAMLVVTALLAYLRRSGAAEKTVVVYQGVGLAVLASLGMAWGMSTLFSMSGAGREAMEGGTMLLASAVLFYCSYWLFAKREAARWQSYVQGQVDQALSGGRLYALGFAAFLAVFREGAETVLFYQALAAGAPGQMPALLGGLALAVVALAALYVAMRVLSIRLPLRLFFSVTAALLYYMAISFAGNGVVEMQNGHVLSVTPLAGWPSLSWLGFYPTVEGVLAQAILVVPLVPWLVWRGLVARKVNPA